MVLLNLGGYSIESILLITSMEQSGPITSITSWLEQSGPEDSRPSLFPTSEFNEKRVRSKVVDPNR